MALPVRPTRLALEVLTVFASREHRGLIERSARAIMFVFWLVTMPGCVDASRQSTDHEAGGAQDAQVDAAAGQPLDGTAPRSDPSSPSGRALRPFEIEIEHMRARLTRLQKLIRTSSGAKVSVFREVTPGRLAPTAFSGRFEHVALVDTTRETAEFAELGVSPVEVRHVLEQCEGTAELMLEELGTMALAVSGNRRELASDAETWCAAFARRLNATQKREVASSVDELEREVGAIRDACLGALEVLRRE